MGGAGIGAFFPHDEAEVVVVDDAVYLPDRFSIEKSAGREFDGPVTAVVRKQGDEGVVVRKAVFQRLGDPCQLVTGIAEPVAGWPLEGRSGHQHLGKAVFLVGEIVGKEIGVRRRPSVDPAILARLKARGKRDGRYGIGGAGPVGEQGQAEEKGEEFIHRWDL